MDVYWWIHSWTNKSSNQSIIFFKISPNDVLCAESDPQNTGIIDRCEEHFGWSLFQNMQCHLYFKECTSILKVLFVITMHQQSSVSSINIYLFIRHSIEYYSILHLNFWSSFFFLRLRVTFKLCNQRVVKSRNLSICIILQNLRRKLCYITNLLGTNAPLKAIQI